ncbi:hypothetical protein D9601_17690 [Sphingomonas sp. MA1305]|uniref:hypothetical protein n=1 Tax=Sphingomonas sp. MA1305 TaxID=2479204 RepID=UPI0018DF54C9|nr:hypothetical protein [Sphingomonas sp. MA1305]MBI0477183.1 hypothetical protein [Sphingomonas sp. MA1305]
MSLPRIVASEIIAHRRNTVEELAATPREHGVEVDIRSIGPDLVIHHDPYVRALAFETWLEGYAHGTLILNVKEEGLEQRLETLMAEAGIDRWFFLDQSFPFMLRTARRGERRCAVRVSEYESPQTALAVASMVDWVWVDLFTPRLPDAATLIGLAEAGLKLCLVSPELQGRDPEAEVAALKRHFADHGVAMDAVCTKRADLWN